MTKELTVKKNELPIGLESAFGCMHCEWRHVGKCPNEDQANHTFNLPRLGICNKRRSWLLSLVPVYDKEPSVDRFMLDFNKSLGNKLFRETLEKKELWESKLKDAELSGDKFEVQRATKMVRQLDQNWKEIWREVTRLHDSQVTRETPKKIEVTKTEKISLSQLHDIMRGDLKTVKGEVLNNEKED